MAKSPKTAINPLTMGTALKLAENYDERIKDSFLIALGPFYYFLEGISSHARTYLFLGELS